jgi:hypothetical protein
VQPVEASKKPHAKNNLRQAKSKLVSMGELLQAKKAMVQLLGAKYSHFLLSNRNNSNNNMLVEYDHSRKQEQDHGLLY